MTIDKIISELQSIEYQLNSVELHVSCPDGVDMLNSAQSDLNILIGELDIIIKERPNIDWPKYRADKTLRLSSTERWITTWKAHTTGNITTVGVFNNKEEAAQAILDEHHKYYERESDDLHK